MRLPKVFRDPVHNVIQLERQEETDSLLLALLDSREMQRLRRVRQLGLANLVFHGAEHSRFGHCLGAMHVARRMLDQLGRDTPLAPADRAPVLAAALLHDLGHGPFSHHSEGLFGMSHEEWTCQVLLDPGTEVHRLLHEWDHELPGRVAQYVRGNAMPRFLGGIVSGQLDCDRLDYILRDGWALGVDVTYDLSRLMGLLSLDRMEDRLVVDARGHDVVEAYLIARHHLYRNVYHHKTTRAAGAMLFAVFRRARLLLREGRLERGCLAPALARALSDQQPTVEEFLANDDGELWIALKQWSQADDSILKRLAGGLLQRRLYKGVQLSRLDIEQRQEANARAGDLLRSAGYEPEFHLLEDRSRDHAYRPYAPDLGREGIFLRWPDATREISESSGLVRSLFEAQEDIRWFVPEELRNELRRLVGATS